VKAVYDAIMACRATSSKNEKIAILTAAKSNAMRLFLATTYEPRINFYQKKIDTKQQVLSLDVDFTGALIQVILNEIAGRKITGNEAKRWLASVRAGFKNEWEREMLDMLIERDVKAGFSGNTVNKVFGEEVVTDVPYMRCSLPKDSKLNDFPWEGGVFSQIKADGMFANVTLNDDGSVVVQSRNGSPFPLVDAFNTLVDEVRAAIPPEQQLHGELLMYKDGKPLPRQDGNGKFNKLLQSGELEPGHTVVFECWDMIPVREAKAKNKYKVDYKTRFNRLQRHLDTFNWKEPALRLIETRIVCSLKEAYEHYRDALERGLEGTIVKHPDMIWEDTTSKYQVKLKLEFEVDLEVVGYEEGKGKAAGSLGALRLQTSDGKLQVKAGSGFSDAQRADIWARKDLKIVTVKSNSIMPPTNKDTYSLFLPIFVEERLDKTVANSLQEVLDQYDATIAAVA
jgi:DNA ligase-1